MRIEPRATSTAILLTALATGLSCRTNGETNLPRDSDQAKPVGLEPMGQPFVDEASELLGKIVFVVRDPAHADHGPSRWVSIDNPARDVSFMDHPDEIVVHQSVLRVVVDYPVTGSWEFTITTPNPSGFTRAELVRGVSSIYNALYLEEERTSQIEVVPPNERKGLINRNPTAGKYGVWGHDLRDLVLDAVEIRRTKDGRVYASLEISS